MDSDSYSGMARPGFPKTLRDFRERFADEDACISYLMQSRWPEGIACAAMPRSAVLAAAPTVGASMLSVRL